MLKDFLKSILGAGLVYSNVAEASNVSSANGRIPTVLAATPLKAGTLAPGVVVKIKAWGRAMNPGSVFLYFGPHVLGQAVVGLGMDAWIAEATVVYAGPSAQSCVGSAVCSEWFRPTNHVSTARTVAARENSEVEIPISLQASSDCSGAITMTGMTVEVVD